MKGFRKYTREICMCLIVLVVIAGFSLKCANLQMGFETANHTSHITKIDLSDTSLGTAELYAEEVNSLRTASIVAKKLASVMKTAKTVRLPADTIFPAIQPDKTPYYFEMNQRLAELFSNRSFLLLQYVHDKDGKKRKTTT